MINPTDTKPLDFDMFISCQQSTPVLRTEIQEDETKDKINYYLLFSFSIMWVSGQFQMLKDGFCLKLMDEKP